MSDSSIASNPEPSPPPLTDAPARPEPARPATPRLYLTSDLRAATGLPRTHMDFYLREGIIQPTARTESGYLLFDERELETLRTVLRWRQHGIGIREIRQRLGRSDG
jgi:MerR HTH family regulatory protein